MSVRLMIRVKNTLTDSRIKWRQVFHFIKASRFGLVVKALGGSQVLLEFESQSSHFSSYLSSKAG